MAVDAYVNVCDVRGNKKLKSSWIIQRKQQIFFKDWQKKKKQQQQQQQKKLCQQAAASAFFLCLFSFSLCLQKCKWKDTHKRAHFKCGGGFLPKRIRWRKKESIWENFFLNFFSCKMICKSLKLKLIKIAEKDANIVLEKTKNKIKNNSFGAYKI